MGTHPGLMAMLARKARAGQSNTQVVLRYTHQSSPSQVVYTLSTSSTSSSFSKSASFSWKACSSTSTVATGAHISPDSSWSMFSPFSVRTLRTSPKCSREEMTCSTPSRQPQDHLPPTRDVAVDAAPGRHATLSGNATKAQHTGGLRKLSQAGRAGSVLFWKGEAWGPATL
eukprot:CAMPEP_0117698096 /NCGR_PEP_ID=MMETSP0804-20121206/29584_1 /TAXON_ID=1074897 /ORGANISM="Tetraselmis astigmatica, Strain CCMP880" /LENGTH=170 /DNA_ID=CAMNT_0005512399 /DNA_START=268 /DNA_END=780 /DNA_ORIENTATION=-